MYLDHIYELSLPEVTPLLAVNALKAMNSFKSCTMYVPTNQQVSVTTAINMFTRDVNNRPVCWLHLVAGNPACTGPVAALMPVEFPDPEREGGTEGGKEGGVK